MAGQRLAAPERLVAPERLANLLGALALGVHDALGAATAQAAGLPASAPAALVALDGFLDGASLDGLRRVVGLTPSGAVRLVDRLAAEGLVERRPGPDGRTVSLRLTRRGRAAARRVARRRAEALQAVLGALSEEEARAAEPLLAKLVGACVDGRAAARRLCRMCDADACGHHEGICPSTLAADAAERERR